MSNCWVFKLHDWIYLFLGMWYRTILGMIFKCQSLSFLIKKILLHCKRKEENRLCSRGLLLFGSGVWLGKYRSVDLFGVAEENCVSVAADMLLLGLLLKAPPGVICSQKRMIFCVVWLSKGCSGENALALWAKEMLLNCSTNVFLV